MCDFPFEFDGVLKDQASYYLEDYDSITQAVGSQGKIVSDALGLNANYTMTEPLKAQFITSDRTQSFLNATLLTVIVFLSILSTMLLYSLMLSDVDAKTYEYGMLRALGFKKKYLVGMITMKSLTFSLPGLFFGVLVAFVLNICLRMMIFLKSDNYSTYTLTTVSIVIGVSFGLIMPIISNYFPI